jgi:hypothetical protein
VSHVKYELGLYNPEDDILHSAVQTSNLTNVDDSRPNFLL